MSIDDRLLDVFAAIFDLSPSDIKESDSPDTIEDWDSVHHLQLVMAVEDTFGVQFDPDDFTELTSVASFQKHLQSLC